MDFSDELDGECKKPEPRRFMPKQRGKGQPKKETGESNVKVKSEKIVEEDKKTDSIVKVKLEKVVEEDTKADSNGKLKLDSGVEEDRKLSLGDGGALCNVVAERVESEVANMEVDNDFVVREIDVYFNPQPDENTLYCMMQFPLRPKWRPLDFDECLKEIRVKPKSAQVEIDIQHEYASSSHQTPHSVKQTLTSSTNLSSKANHAVGILQGNNLYISPLQAVLQNRPDIESTEDGVNMEMDEKVNGRGTKVPKDSAGKRPVASSKEQNKMISPGTHNTEAEESWVPLKYHNSSSEVSSNCLKKLMTANQSDIPLTVNPCDYLNSFYPGKADDRMRQKFLSMRSLPLETRLKKWLSEGDSQAYKFSFLKHLAPEVSAEDVIEVLEKYAVLVQGLWVPKNSTLLVDSNATTSRATVCKALARDYVILKFSKKLKFTDEELGSYERIMQSSLREALYGLGIYSDFLKKWKLREPADPSFVKLYPSVAKRQEQLLEAHAPEILSRMRASLDRRIRNVQNLQIPVEKREALIKALEVLFKNHSVHSLETICRGLRDMAVSASSLQNTGDRNWMTIAASCVNSKEELKSVLTNFTTTIHGIYIAKSSPTNPELNHLRDIVLQLFRVQAPNGKLKKANIMKAAELELKKEVPESHYNKVMSELCESSSGGWMLKKPL